jgi:hypothetical protein
MVNYSLIEKAAQEVIKYQDQHFRTSMTWEQAYAAVHDWYDYTDITSPYLLSACVLSFGEKYKPVTYSQILDAAKQYEN